MNKKSFARCAQECDSKNFEEQALNQGHESLIAFIKDKRQEFQHFKNLFLKKDEALKKAEEDLQELKEERDSLLPYKSRFEEMILYQQRLGFEQNRLKQELFEANCQLKTLNDSRFPERMFELNTQLLKRASQIQNLRITLQKQQQLNKMIKNDNHRKELELLETVREFKIKLDEALKELSQSKAKQEALRDSLKILKDSNDNKTAQIQHLNSQLGKAKESISECQSQLIKLNESSFAQRQTSEEEKLRLLRKIALLQTGLEQKDYKLQAANSQNSHLRTKIKSQEYAILELEKNIHELNENDKENLLEKRKLINRAEFSQEECQKLNNTINVLQQRISYLEEQLNCRLTQRQNLMKSGKDLLYQRESLLQEYRSEFGKISDILQELREK